MELNTIQEIIDDIRLGKMVILMDDEDRENEGDLIMAADQVRAEDINFMATEARGLICLTLTEERCRQLDLPLMVKDNLAPLSTNFTVSIEAAEGVTTGISAADRARTVRAAVQSDAGPKDLVQPGHIFPVMSQVGGVLSRAGHTEAGCDLARLAGLEPAAAIVEVMNEDGSMARRPDLEKFAEKHDLKIGTIADLIQYRTVHEKTVVCINERQVETEYGDFQLRTYRDTARNECHFALTKGVVALVLICHNETTEEIEEGIDWLLSGKGLRPKQEVGYKQVGAGSQILQDLGVKKMRLLSAPFKFKAISGFNLEVVEYITTS